MTDKSVESAIWESAFDFHRAVVPILARWLPDGGHFVSVEDAPDHPAIKVVDTVAGIDGWVTSERGTRLQGIASRVRYGTEPYESFTIRARRPGGAVTELAKRLGALKDRDSHYVVPHFTVQAQVERRRTGEALLVLMVRTQDLFEFVQQHGNKVEHRRNPEDGTEFLVVWADDLRAAGYEVKQGGSREDVTIRLRGGQSWNPADLAHQEWLASEAQAEADEVQGYWTGDDGETCAFCGVDMVLGGIRAACGTPQI